MVSQKAKEKLLLAPQLTGIGQGPLIKEEYPPLSTIESRFKKTRPSQRQSLRLRPKRERWRIIAERHALERPEGIAGSERACRSSEQRIHRSRIIACAPGKEKGRHVEIAPLLLLPWLHRRMHAAARATEEP